MDIDLVLGRDFLKARDIKLKMKSKTTRRRYSTETLLNIRNKHCLDCTPSLCRICIDPACIPVHCRSIANAPHLSPNPSGLTVADNLNVCTSVIKPSSSETVIISDDSAATDFGSLPMTSCPPDTSSGASRPAVRTLHSARPVRIEPSSVLPVQSNDLPKVNCRPKPSIIFGLSDGNSEKIVPEPIVGANLLLKEAAELRRLIMTEYVNSPNFGIDPLDFSMRLSLSSDAPVTTGPRRLSFEERKLVQDKKPKD